MHVTIGVDPGKVTGWAIASGGKLVCWGQGEPEAAAQAIIDELRGMDEPVRLLIEAAYQGRFGAGVQVAFRSGLILGMLKAHLPQESVVIMAPASQWRKALGWKGGKDGRKAAKDRARAFAYDLTEDKEMKFANREHVAEAICMAMAANAIEV